ncbi:annexin A13-like [Lycorma delicatula]|uniref:annexin A13-like n=1 Tax=Lycorma delicatula TaxID=130591 RepID=UPI003F50F9F9
MRKFLIIFILSSFIANFIQCEQTTAKPSANVQKSKGIQGSDVYTDYNITTDIKQLYDAMVGIGTNETAIIDVIANRNSAQRQAIIKMYSDVYDKNVVQDLRGETSGNFRDTITALMLDRDDYLAKQLNKAITSFLPNDHTIIEILCTKSKDELLSLMITYEKLYNKSLKKEIEEYAALDYKVFLTSILSEKLREKGTAVDTGKAKQQVTYIPETADKCTVVNNPNLNEFLAKESFAQIKYVSEMYKKDKGKSLKEQIKKLCEENSILSEAYGTVVRYADDPAEYYAEELYNAMIGLGTNDEKLIRIIATQSDAELKQIKNKYKQLYSRSLESSIDEETSGFYEKVLLRVIEKADAADIK